LVSDGTAKAARSRYKLHPRDPITVKNRQQPVVLWEVDWQRASGAF
jgi:class 3 adenylate cyclase